ncbi:MAG: transposase family protein, partial [Leptolyngbya sp. SIO4C1]|nr:transposase family protein [Leptolyngbya sp. SIO4C1]
RRVREWKALHGPEPEVMFMLRHEPGVMGLSDFTKLKGMEITLNGAPFEHLIYHYRLAYSGWQYAQIIQGGESFIALSEGLQNALAASGGAPQEHRTDSLSAAYRNSGGHRTSELTQFYEDLCEHYRMVPTRNNKGKANENGSVESPHGHLKNRIKQLVYLRGSSDFESIADYQAVIDQAAAGLNRQCEAKYEAEKAVLQALPQRRVADYEILSAKVSCHSTIDVRCILYSVPSRLIGQQLEIHLYHDRLVGYFARQPVFEQARLRVSGKGRRRGRCIDYRHLIGGLRKKPRAFLFCKWQNDLLPTAEFRQLWQEMKVQFERDQAAKLMVEALYIAATYDKEQAVADYLSDALEKKQLTLSRLQQQFMPSAVNTLPPIETQQHVLNSYDQLLRCSDDSHNGSSNDTRPPEGNDTNAQRQSLSTVELSAQTAQAHQHAHPLGSYREPSFAAAMVLCTILTQLVSTRGRQKRPDAAKAHQKRSAASRRKKFDQL